MPAACLTNRGVFGSLKNSLFLLSPLSLDQQRKWRERNWLPGLRLSKRRNITSVVGQGTASLRQPGFGCAGGGRAIPVRTPDSSLTMLEPAIQIKTGYRTQPDRKNVPALGGLVLHTFFRASQVRRLGWAIRKQTLSFPPLFSLGPAKKRGARVQGAGCPYH